MDCCRSGPCEEFFKPRTARKALEGYRRDGPDEIERHMIRAASSEALAGARVLEIGGGIGVIQAELLEAGAGSGEIVELVSAWEPYAQELAREKGLAERSSFRVADVLQNPAGVQPADVVVLNRVVCCSPDGVALAAAAARLASRTLVLSFPREARWIHAAIWLLNAGLRVMRRSFRVFLHPREALLGAAEAAGLELASQGTEGFWEYAALSRPSR